MYYDKDWKKSVCSLPCRRRDGGQIIVRKCR